jgi:hypothetical protein
METGCQLGQKPCSALVCTAHLVLGVFLSFIILYTADGTPWAGYQPPEGRCLYTGQHKRNKHTGIHASSGIRTHDPSASAGEDSS